MNNIITYVAAILLIIIIIVILDAARRWNRENDQQSFWDAIRDNKNAFLRELSDGEPNITVAPRYEAFGSMVATLEFMVVMVVLESLFFKLGNHGANPCKINHIEIKDENMQYSTHINKKDLR